MLFTNLLHSGPTYWTCHARAQYCYTGLHKWMVHEYLLAGKTGLFQKRILAWCLLWSSDGNCCLTIDLNSWSKYMLQVVTVVLLQVRFIKSAISYKTFHFIVVNNHTYINQWTLLWFAVCLTHWGRVTHICVIDLTIIGSDNGLSPGRH